MPERPEDPLGLFEDALEELVRQDGQAGAHADLVDIRASVPHRRSATGLGTA